MQLGIDKRVGSIDAGKDADLVIYNHDPLSAYAVVQKTLIDGRVYFDRQRDIAERADPRKRKESADRKRKESRREKADERNPARKSPTTRRRSRTKSLNRRSARLPSSGGAL